MDFNIIIKKTVQDICGEVKKEENMNLIKRRSIKSSCRTCYISIISIFFKVFCSFRFINNNDSFFDNS